MNTFTHPHELDAFLVETIANAFQAVQQLVTKRRIDGLVPYTQAEGVGLFVTQVRTRLHGNYTMHADASAKKVTDHFTNAENYADAGIPRHVPYRPWTLRMTLPGGEWSIHPQRATELFKMARDKAMVVGYDGKAEDAFIDELVTSIRSDLPRMARMVTELEVLNADHTEVQSNIERLQAAL